MNAWDFVTLQQVKDHLRVDNDAEDDDIALKISAASVMIAMYVQNRELFQDSSGEIPQDSSGDPIVDDDIKMATLMLVGILYRDRDGTEAEKWQQGYLPFAVTALIYWRRPLSMA